MKLSFIIALAVITAISCSETGVAYSPETDPPLNVRSGVSPFAADSWPYYLQHLPLKRGPILDYRGQPVSNQGKGFAIVDYDIGKMDLQQCADALIRLRAEYLFAQGRQDEIRFHFTSGHLFSWTAYCTGQRPVVRGASVSFIRVGSCAQTHANLRRYLDIVFSYAGTISLYHELKEAGRLDIGTVIITPGSPGHCCIVIDDSIGADKTRFYKLAEGYSPTQSIYVLRNPEFPGNSPWYDLLPGVISTASYTFTNYKLGRFE